MNSGAICFFIVIWDVSSDSISVLVLPSPLSVYGPQAAEGVSAIVTCYMALGLDTFDRGNKKPCIISFF